MQAWKGLEQSGSKATIEWTILVADYNKVSCIVTLAVEGWVYRFLTYIMWEV